MPLLKILKHEIYRPAQNKVTSESKNFYQLNSKEYGFHF